MSLKGFLGHFRRAIDRQDCEARVSEPDFLPKWHQYRLHYTGLDSLRSVLACLIRDVLEGRLPPDSTARLIIMLCVLDTAS